jgi:hypothetical protein
MVGHRSGLFAETVLIDHAVRVHFEEVFVKGPINRTSGFIFLSAWFWEFFGVFLFSNFRLFRGRLIAFGLFGLSG